MNARRPALAALALLVLAGTVVAATPADVDGDGLPARAELLDHGTNPLAADTDGDGLDDPTELDAPTDPTAADTDGDGLDDPTELDAPTDPATDDTDGDELDDGTETELGTDPTEGDTDGDGLPDGWEHSGETPTGDPLPDADPLRMDLYVQAYAAAGVSGLDGYDAVVEHFATMPVENPDGSTGVAVHVVDGGSLDGRPVFDGSESSFSSIKYDYDGTTLQYHPDVYRVVLFVPFEDTNYTGYADIPGEYVLIDGARNRATKEGVLVHELLHTVVGGFYVDDRCREDLHHHCSGGWLNRTIDGDDTYLSEPVAELLEERGFRD